MMYRFILFLICFFSILSGIAHANSSNIHIRYGIHSDKQRLVMDFGHRVDANVFSLDNPHRIVVDLPKDQWKIDVSKTVEKGHVKAIRIGEFEQDTSRIVIDMTKSAAIEQTFWLPAVQGLKNRLVIDYREGTPLPTTSQKSLDQVLQQTLHPQQQSGSPQIVNGVVTPSRKPSLAEQKIAAQKPAYKPLIVIDAGHGGKDPGAIAKNGLYEKTVVLKIAKELAHALKATGRYRTMLTRNNDKYIRLKDRIGLARKHEADLFISIHADAIENKHVSGASVYTLSEKASDAQTAKLAARENKSDLIAGIDLETEDPDVTNILLDLVTRETTNQSKFFANLIVDEFQGHHVKTLERPHRHAGFAVLKAPDVPAILIETGFMSNPKEVRRLNTPQYRKNIIKSLQSGIDAYFIRLASLN